MCGVKRFLKSKPAPKGFRTCHRCRGVFPRDQFYTTGHCAMCEPISRREWLDAVPGRRAHDARMKRDRNLAKRVAGRGRTRCAHVMTDTEVRASTTTGAGYRQAGRSGARVPAIGTAADRCNTEPITNVTPGPIRDGMT